mmetsp:Transcript_5076/g.19023  ORF Transcript_5076/g.19023 Transcript_5076/m.19023 type:complete len:172 (-) Transcript_5076:166-681(-)|eukprot:CAMPEP_0117446832 /NCGR_PEP_ID=MMETSP0759-20121206/6553_1 /TAXON_ID=63605 /ORGANISM="Percolomonas cosmopolitus, Strain WS" /LENGTH=171 /DNA_ID=CAMNT_0005239129 /DNA_START=8 /DNA_END=523 /DNA_ORIENTATION=-
MSSASPQQTTSHQEQHDKELAQKPYSTWEQTKLRLRRALAKDGNVLPEDQERAQRYPIDSGAVILALAPGLITYCKKPNTDYLRCKAKNNDPEACLFEAMEARKCGFELANMYQDPKFGCNQLFASYVSCIKSNRQRQARCIRPRTYFENCAHERLGIEFHDPVNLSGEKV